MDSEPKVVLREDFIKQALAGAAKTIFNEAQAAMQEAKEAEVAKYKSRRMSSKDTITSWLREEARNTRAEDIAVIIQSRLVVSGLWWAVDTCIFAVIVADFGTYDFSG